MGWYGQSISKKRVHYALLLTLLGTLANITALDMPIVISFSIGNVALFLIALRLGPLWALPAALVILLPLTQHQAIAASLLQLLLLLGFRHRIRHLTGTAVLLYFGLSLALFRQIAPAQISDDWFYLCLHSALSTAVFAFCLRAMLILDMLTMSALREQQQSHTAVITPYRYVQQYSVYLAHCTGVAWRYRIGFIAIFIALPNRTTATERANSRAPFRLYQTGETLCQHGDRDEPLAGFANTGQPTT